MGILSSISYYRSDQLSFYSHKALLEVMKRRMDEMFEEAIEEVGSAAKA